MSSRFFLIKSSQSYNDDDPLLAAECIIITRGNEKVSTVICSSTPGRTPQRCGEGERGASLPQAPPLRTRPVKLQLFPPLDVRAYKVQALAVAQDHIIKFRGRVRIKMHHCLAFPTTPHHQALFHALKVLENWVDF